MSHIKSLILEGFQTIQERTEIPVTGLTLLFGPNSAGKSAICDAIELSENLFTISIRKEEEKEFFDELPYGRMASAIEKNWRKTSPKQQPSSYSDRMVVGVIADAPRYIFTDLPDHFSYVEYDSSISSENLANIEVALVATFHDLRDIEPGFTGMPCLRDFELRLAGKSFAILKEFGSFGINMEHDLLSISPETAETSISSLKELPEIRIEDGWIWIDDFEESVRIHGNKKFDREQYEFETKALRKKDLECLRMITDVYDHLISKVMQQLSFTPDLVKASRSIPLTNDLSFSISSHWNEEKILEKFNSTPNSDEEFRRLAESCASTLPYPKWSSSGESGRMLKNINSILSDYLFIDRGYQIRFDHALVISPEQYKELSEEWDQEIYIEKLGILLQIYITDSKGINFDFSDVGSGLGYSLPVLCSLTGSDDFVFIQQPELHLHPALQSAMGDVLIKSMEKDRQIVAETHSEHILLRILRRIRQSNNDATQNEHLFVSAEDVTVLYFDSLADGTTKVKNLRISRDGEFMDRWPHGFFEERDGDLFDE